MKRVEVKVTVVEDGMRLSRSVSLDVPSLSSAAHLLNTIAMQVECLLDKWKDGEPPR